MCQYLGFLLISLAALILDVQGRPYPLQDPFGQENAAQCQSRRFSPSVTCHEPYEPLAVLEKRSLPPRGQDDPRADTADSWARPRLLEQAAAVSYGILHDKRVIDFRTFLNLVVKIKDSIGRHPTQADIVAMMRKAYRMAQGSAHIYGGPRGDPAFVAAYAVKQYHNARFAAEGINGRTGYPRSASLKHPHYAPPTKLQRRGLDVHPNPFLLLPHKGTSPPIEPSNAYFKAQPFNEHPQVAPPKIPRKEGRLDDTADSEERTTVRLAAAAKTEWARLLAGHSSMSGEQFAKIVLAAFEARKDPQKGGPRFVAAQKEATAKGQASEYQIAIHVVDTISRKRPATKGWGTVNMVAGGSSAAVRQSENGKALSEGLSADEHLASPPTKKHRANGQH